MKTIQTILLFAILTVVTFAVTNKNDIQNVGQALSGLPSTSATTSTIVVGPGNNTVLFTANTVCASRVVGTTGLPITLSFDVQSSTTPSQAIGFVQAASTTVAYDSGLFGCGLVVARGGLASTTIIINEQI